MTRTVTKDALGVFGVFRIGHDAFVQHATSSGPFQPTPGRFFGRLGRLGYMGLRAGSPRRGSFGAFGTNWQVSLVLNCAATCSCVPCYTLLDPMVLMHTGSRTCEQASQWRRGLRLERYREASKLFETSKPVFAILRTHWPHKFPPAHAAKVYIVTNAGSALTSIVPTGRMLRLYLSERETRSHHQQALGPQPIRMDDESTLFGNQPTGEQSRGSTRDLSPSTGRLSRLGKVTLFLKRKKKSLPCY